MKLLIPLLLVFSFNSLAEKIDNMKLAKKLKSITGIQVDMNVETDDKCVYEQVNVLLDQAKSFKRNTRKNLMAYLDNHYSGIVFSPTKNVGKLNGSLGKVTLKKQFLSEGYFGVNLNTRDITERVVWDTRSYEGFENKNSFTEENGKINFLIKKSDQRFKQYDFVVFQNRMNRDGRIREIMDWSDKFKYPIDEISALEVSDESSKMEMGSIECGKPLTWFDFGFEASFLF